MDQTNMVCVTNEEEIDKVQTGNDYHNINMQAKSFCRACQNAGIPVFVAYFLPNKGYKYQGIFPEEVNNPEVESEYGKFTKFLQVCIGFNREDYFPTQKQD